MGLRVESPGFEPRLRLLDDRPGAGPDGSRAVPLDASVLAELVRISQRYSQLVKTENQAGLLRLGMDLYQLLDAGPGQGWLEGVKRRSQGRWLFQVRSELPQPHDSEWPVLHAPWELLADDQGYWAVDARLGYTPVRRLGAHQAAKTLDDYRLGVVFMTAAPRGQHELDFEAEEAAILRATGSLGMDLEVEDSGNPDVLRERLTALARYPVLHVSCHGHHAWPTPGAPEGAVARPTLFLETLTGGELPVDAQALVDSLGAVRPRLLFLSACESAKAGEGAEAGGGAQVAQSMATALVQAGVSATLGWEGSVRDVAATAFAHHLYQRLAAREPLEEAVAFARRALAAGTTPAIGPRRDEARRDGEGRGGAAEVGLGAGSSAAALQRDWHLARLWLGQDGGGPLVAGKLKRRRVGGDHGHKDLLVSK